MTELRTLPEALADAARGRAGYVFVDGRIERRRSYREMYEAARTGARALRALGLERGDVIALIIDDQERFLTALFATSMAGLVPACVYPPATASDLPRYLDATGNILRTARARAMVTSPALVGAMAQLRARCPDLEFVMASDFTGGGTDTGGARSSGARDDAHNASPRTAPTVPTIDADCPLAKPSSTGLAGCASPARYFSSDASPDICADAPSVQAGDLALVQFTSGSTSRPKGVAITHRSLAANIEAINGPAGLASSDADSAVSWLPLYHDMGLIGMALGAMYRGRPAVLMTPATFVKRPIEWLRAISRHRATVSFAPNFAYDLCVRRVKDHDLEGIDLSCWRVAGCGAEPIHAATLAAFADRFRAAGFQATSFLPSYGLAEHVLAATLAPAGRTLRIDRRSGVDLVSCGSPLPDHRLRIVTDDGRDAAEGITGEIALAGPSVMQRYYGAAQMTVDTIRDGWLYTGDVGYLVDGELFVCGRTKEIVVVNGRKHHPQDLEWALEDLAGLRRGRVVAFGTARSGLPDRLVMVVEPSGTVATEQLTMSIRHRISDVCGLYVDEVVLVPSGTIARTTSGKLQRVAVKARYEAGEFGA